MADPIATQPTFGSRCVIVDDERAKFQCFETDFSPTFFPAFFFIKGELGFFDFYIIPLAKKLRDCGVFGVSSDEYLGYAERNREEWEMRGPSVVEGMVERIRAKYHPHQQNEDGGRAPSLTHSFSD